MLYCLCFSSSRRERLGLYRIIRALLLWAGVAVHALAQSSQAATEAAAAVDQRSIAVSEGTVEAAAKDAAQNPIAAATRVPLQNNICYGVGPYRRAENILLVEPESAFKISSNWIVITRTNLPVEVDWERASHRCEWTLDPTISLTR